MTDNITIKKDTNNRYQIIKNGKEIGKMRSKIEAMQNAITMAKESPVETEVHIEKG